MWYTHSCPQRAGWGMGALQWTLAGLLRGDLLFWGFSQILPRFILGMHKAVCSNVFFRQNASPPKTAWNNASKTRWSLGCWGSDAGLQWDPRLSSRAVAHSVLPSVGIRMALGLNVWIPIFFLLLHPLFGDLTICFWMTKKITYWHGFPGIWTGHRSDHSPWAGQVLQWHCSGHMCFLPPCVHAMLSASNALPCLANLTESSFFWTRMGISMSVKPSLASFHPFSHDFVSLYIHSFNHVYWICIMCQVNKINMVPVLAKLMI